MPFKSLQAVAQGVCRALHHQPPPREIVEQAGFLLIDCGDILIEERDVPLTAQSRVHGGGFANQFLHCVLVFRCAELRGDQLFQALKCGFVAKQFARGLKLRRHDRLRHTLGIGFKQPHAVDVVPEQLNAQGIRAAFGIAVRIRKSTERGIDIDDAAAQGELPGAVDQIHTDKARPGKAFCQFGQVKRFVGVDCDGRLLQDLGRYGIAERRVGGGENGVVLPCHESRQHLDALVLVLMRGGHIIEGEVARHIEACAQTKALQKSAQFYAVLLFGAQNQRRAAALALGILQKRDKECVRRALAQSARENRKRVRPKVLFR